MPKYGFSQYKCYFFLFIYLSFFYLVFMKLSKEVKTGIVTLVAIAVVIYGFNFLNGTNILKKRNYVYAIYDKTDGLIEASPILISGVKVGQVHETKLIKRDN